MKWAIYQSRLKRVLRHRHLLARLVLAQFCLLGLLILMLFYAFIHERVVLTPPVIEKRFWVSRDTVSDEYLAEMTHFFMGLRFNLTPGNVVRQRDLLLRYTDPAVYTALKTQLVTDGDHLINEHLTLSFYPVDMKVNTTSLTVNITGDVVAMAGNTPLPASRVTYQVHYTYHDGRLLVSSFKELQPHA